MTHVKICGVRTVADALACAAMGVSAIGVNFIRTSPRSVDLARGLAIARAVHDAKLPTLVVGVVADLDVQSMRALARDADLDCLQLHGDEPPEHLALMLPHAYKAIGVASSADALRARAYGGDHLLVDAAPRGGARGGTGATFDWSLVVALASERRLTLAGGLRADNVAAAVAAVHPYCVDVASGVERSAGVKDLAAVRAFVDAVRSAG